MAREAAGGEPRLATPFLEGRERRRSRDLAIAEEVEEYLQKAKEALAEAKIQEAYPKDKRTPVEFPSRPDTLEWLGRVERWGLPNLGTFLDQPKEFMADLDAAKLARDVFRREDAKPAQDVEALFRDAPAFGALRTR